MSGITAANRARFLALQGLGCIACIIEGEKRGEDRRGTPSDVHHVLNGYRAGHDVTIPLCPWHHRGVPPFAMGNWQAVTTFGPSKARNPKAFATEYGSDYDLLERVNTELAHIGRIENGET